MLAPVTVHKILPDGSEWGYWDGFHLPVTTECALVWTPMATPMHWRYSTWPARHHEITFFWPNRWYVINAFYNNDLRFAGCYFDIVLPNSPDLLNAGEMRYTDLYVDVVVGDDYSVYTKDEEVYERAMRHNAELAELHDRAFSELVALADHARNWTGPFTAIAPTITQLEWQLLDPQSEEFAQARDRQWGGVDWNT